MIRGLPRLRRLTTALGALFCASAAHALEIDLQPTTIEVPSEPGGRIQQVFTVSNRGGEDAIGLTIGLADWTLAQDGDLKLLPPGSEASSASVQAVVVKANALMAQISDNERSLIKTLFLL